MNSWHTRYRRAFIARALSWHWTREDAEIWADHMVDEAFLACGREAPAVVAVRDVRECEMEGMYV